MLKSIQTKMVLFFGMLFVVTGVILSYSVFNSSMNLVINSIGNQAKNAAQQAVKQIDVEEFQRIIVEVRKNSNDEVNQKRVMEMTEYINLHQKLNTLKETSGLKALYTMVELQGNKHMYIVDAGDDDNKDFAKPGEIEDEDYPMLSVTFQTKKSETGELTYNEKDGASITAYVPIFDNNGKMVAVVGADFDATEIYNLMKKNQLHITITVLSTLLIGLLISVMFARFLIKPLRSLVLVVEQVSQGDLTIHLASDSKDEVGQLSAAFNTMTVNLRNLIKQVANASNQLATSSKELSAHSEQCAHAANQISSSAMEVASGAEQQHNAVLDTMKVVNQMSGTIEQVAANTDSVTANSDSTVVDAQEGGQAIDNAITQMGNIEKTVTHSAQVVARLGKRSKEIGQIVEAISGIASQTNLLALNAAIEAARAGEQGRGFSVVAEEVRKLAEQSQEAAQQIAVLIRGVQSETTDAVVSMEEGTREVKLGIDVVNTAGKKFGEIATRINQVSSQIQTISASIHQMASGNQQIYSSVHEVDKISKVAAEQAQNVSATTEEQSAAMEEIASFSLNLTKTADELQNSLEKFRFN